MTTPSIIRQQSPTMWFELGNKFSSKREFEQAAKAYSFAIECGAQDPRCYFNLGVVRTIQKRVEEAECCYAEALRLRPNYPEAHNNLAILRQVRGDVDDACRHYVESFAGHNSFPEARYNYASLLQQRGLLEEACGEYRTFLKDKPRHAAGHNNLGNTLIALARPGEALTHFERALALDPATPEARFNRAVARLTLGQYKSGWRDYESRFHQPGRPGRRSAGTEWKGQSLENKRMLLYAEQGLGDTLQFIRFAKAIQQRGARLVLECQSRLVRILGRMPELETVLAKDDPKPHLDFKWRCSALPIVFRLNPGDHSKRSHLTAASELKDEWRVFLEGIEVPASSRVGLCWSGNPQHKNDRNRSMPALFLERLRDVPGISFFNLSPEAPTGRIWIYDLDCAHSSILRIRLL